MAQIFQIKSAIEVVAHQEDVVHRVLRGVVIHFVDLVLTGADGGGQLILAAGFRRKLIQHGTQIFHQLHIGRPVLRAAQFRVSALPTREFPVDIHPVKELPGLQELFHRTDEAIALHLIAHKEERVGQCPAADRRQDFQIGTRLFERHQLTEVAFVGVIPGGDALLPFLQRGERIVDRHLEVFTALAGTLQRLETAFDLFETVVNAVTAADRDKTVQQVRQVLRRNFIDGEVTVINAPFNEIRTDDFAGVLFIRFILFQ
ncbi:hypothetical protein D3C81_233230 [compost metagenome]